MSEYRRLGNICSWFRVCMCVCVCVCDMKRNRKGMWWPGVCSNRSARIPPRDSSLHHFPKTLEMLGETKQNNKKIAK